MNKKLFITKKNATSLGKYKVNRGIRNIFDVGKVLSFDDSNSSKAFTGSCGEIRGTDGSMQVIISFLTSGCSIGDKFNKLQF